MRLPSLLPTQTLRSKSSNCAEFGTSKLHPANAPGDEECRETDQCSRCGVGGVVVAANHSREGHQGGSENKNPSQAGQRGANHQTRSSYGRHMPAGEKACLISIPMQQPEIQPTQR